MGCVTACPIGNTERLVSCDEPWASAKGDFSGSALLPRFSAATGAVSGAFWREDPHPCIDAQPLSVAGGSGVSAEPLCSAMHWLNTGYGIWFNRRYRRHGALFQGRYKAILF